MKHTWNSPGLPAQLTPLRGCTAMALPLRMDERMEAGARGTLPRPTVSPPLCLLVGHLTIRTLFPHQRCQWHGARGAEWKGRGSLIGKSRGKTQKVRPGGRFWDRSGDILYVTRSPSTTGSKKTPGIRGRAFRPPLCRPKSARPGAASRVTASRCGFTVGRTARTLSPVATTSTATSSAPPASKRVPLAPRTAFLRRCPPSSR